MFELRCVFVYELCVMPKFNIIFHSIYKSKASIICVNKNEIEICTLTRVCIYIDSSISSMQSSWRTSLCS